MERLDALGQISDEPGRLTRLYGSPAMTRANDLAGGWMREAGMTVRTDAIGNLIGHFPASQPEAKILLIGSHLDTVPNAGKYDGPLGVVLGIACVEQIRRKVKNLPFAIEVLGIADEEGVRFKTSYFGSRALAGKWLDAYLTSKDADDITVKDAIKAFGGDPGKIDSCKLDESKVIGYVEAHIEQGPVLERRNLPVGVVSAISGQSHAKIAFEGEAGHAGTTPMDMRKDALCAAADFILYVEEYAKKHPSLMATVGQIQLDPNVRNVIPGRCEMTLDLRHANDEVRNLALKEIGTVVGHVANRRGLKCHYSSVHNSPSVACCREFSTNLRLVARRHVQEVLELPSGAGHDAVMMSNIAPVAMLFVRCKEGISHHPDESVRADDVRVALDVLTDFILSLPCP